MQKLLLFLFLPWCLLLGQAGLAPNFEQVFLDNNGLPLAGGRIYTCTAGSSCPGTPLATYTDATGTTANTNPVILDASGRANIWLTTGSIYKFVLQTSAGVTLKTVDDIVGLAPPSGAATNYWTLNSGAQSISNNNGSGVGPVNIGGTLNVSGDELLQGQLKLRDTQATANYAIIRAPNCVGTLTGGTCTGVDTTWRWPATDLAGCMVSDGIGNLSFSTSCGGGGGGGGGGAVGPTLAIQYNNAGALAGTAAAEVDSSGNLTLGGGTSAASTSQLQITGTGPNAGLNITGTTAKSASIQSVGGINLPLATADTTGLTIKQASTPSVDAIDLKNNSNTVIFSVGSLGTTTAPGFVGTNTTTNVTFQNTDSTKFNVTGAGTLTTQNLTIAAITGMAQCLQVNTSGVVSGSGGTCGAGGGGAPGSPSTSVQYNSGGTFAGSANMVWDNTNHLLTITALDAAHAGLTVATGFIQSAVGFLTTGTQGTSIQTSGGITANNTTASIVPLTLNAAASQSADLTDWKNNGGTTLASVSSAGGFIIPSLQLTGITGPVQCLHVNGVGVVTGTGSDCGSGSGGGTPAGPTSAIQFNNAGVFGGTGNALVDANGNLSLGGSGSVLAINGATGGVNITANTGANSFQTVGGYTSTASGASIAFKLNSNNFLVDGNGNVSLAGSGSVISIQGATGGVNITADTSGASYQTVGGYTANLSNATTVGLTIRGASGQSSDLADFKNISGSVLASIGSLGTMTASGHVGTNTGTNATFQNQSANFLVNGNGALTATQITDSGIGGTQCLHAVGGVISGTGFDCSSGGGVASVTASAPLSSSGGTNPNISCPGCLTSAVTSLTGTTNEITVSSSTGAVTLSTPAINTSGQFIGSGGVNTPGTINTNSTYQVLGSTVIDITGRFVGNGGIGTSGTINTTSTLSAGSGNFSVGSLGTVTAPGISIGSGGILIQGLTGVTGSTCSHWTNGICTSP